MNLYDFPSGQRRATLDASAPLAFSPQSSLAFSPDGKTLAIGVALWDVATGKERGAFTGHTEGHEVLSVAFSPDGKTVASATWLFKVGGTDSEVKLWDAKTRQELMIVHKEAINHQALTGAVQELAFSPDGKTLAMVGWERKIRLWDLTKKEERWVSNALGNSYLTLGLVFSPDGKTLAVANDDDQVKLLDAATGQELATLEGFRKEKNQHVTIFTLAFTPDGKTLAAGSSIFGGKVGHRTFTAQVKLWDTATRKEITTIDCKMGMIHSLAFSPDGKILATGGPRRSSLDADGTTMAYEAGIVKLWEMNGAK